MSLHVQLLGLALLIVGAFVLWGIGWALIVAGACTLTFGVALELDHDAEGVNDGASETADT